VAAVVAVDADALEDFVLATAPEYAADRRAADRDLAADRAQPAAEVIDRIRRKG